MNADEILKESEEIKKNIEQNSKSIDGFLKFAPEQAEILWNRNVNFRERARENIKLISKDKIKGCSKVIYNYSNQRLNGNNMEDICCGDLLFTGLELCEDCQEKINQAKKNFEEVLK